jgi:hypothetical protein
MQRRKLETRLQAATVAPQVSEIMSHPSLEMLPPTELKPYPRNARTHSKKQVRQIANSIQRFGFTNPVLIDNDNVILAGNGRVAAAKLLDIPSVPCVRIETMSPAEKRAYVLADNKLALNASWDEEILAEELKGLLGDDLRFDLDVTGFSIAEVDAIIDNIAPEEPGAPEDTGCRTRFRLAVHRVIFGSLVATASPARTRSTRQQSRSSWGRSGRRWSSPILPTMCPCKVTSVVQGQSSIASSPWRRVR